MTRYALLAALLGALTLSGALWWSMSRNGVLRSERDALRVSLASARAAMAQAEEAAAVHRIYLDRQQAETERWAALARDLQKMEGRDAPLSALLRATADRLYGQP